MKFGISYYNFKKLGLVYYFYRKGDFFRRNSFTANYEIETQKNRFIVNEIERDVLLFVISKSIK